MSYLDLVENYPREYEITQFEKVLLAVARAKDLHTGKAVQLVPSTHKHPYMALEEAKEKAIALDYKIDADAEAIPEDSDDSEEE